MKVVGLSGSIIGSKTVTALKYIEDLVQNKYYETEYTLLNLAEYDLQFSDGRHYLQYEGDTGFVTKKIMEADAIIIGTPIFQASIPATLKNIFDLLPADAFRNKVVGIVVTAGTAKHFLVAEQQLKPILSYMNAYIIQKYVFVTEESFQGKKIIDLDTIHRLNNLLRETLSSSQILAEKDRTYECKY